MYLCDLQRCLEEWPMTYCARNSLISCCSFSSLMRVNNFVPKDLIVSGLSKGIRAYIFPPLKWQGWQRASRIGLICVAKSTFAGLVEEEGRAGKGSNCAAEAALGRRLLQALRVAASANAEISNAARMDFMLFRSKRHWQLICSQLSAACSEPRSAGWSWNVFKDV